MFSSEAYKPDSVIGNDLSIAWSFITVPLWAEKGTDPFR